MAFEATDLRDDAGLGVDADLGDVKDSGDNAASNDMPAIEVVDLGDSFFEYLYFNFLCGVEYLSARFGDEPTGSFTATHAEIGFFFCLPFALFSNVLLDDLGDGFFKIFFEAFCCFFFKPSLYLFGRKKVAPFSPSLLSS